MPEAEIKVYGTRVCPDCARAKRVFEKCKVGYAWIDIEQDKQAAAYVVQVNGGYKSVPTILFPDGSVLVEPADSVLEKKLKDL